MKCAAHSRFHPESLVRYRKMHCAGAGVGTINTELFQGYGLSSHGVELGKMSENTLAPVRRFCFSHSLRWVVFVLVLYLIVFALISICFFASINSVSNCGNLGWGLQILNFFPDHSLRCAFFLLWISM